MILSILRNLLKNLERVYCPLPKVSFCIKGIGVTYPETQTIYDGGIVNGLTVDKMLWNYNHSTRKSTNIL